MRLPHFLPKQALPTTRQEAHLRCCCERQLHLSQQFRTVGRLRMWSRTARRPLHPCQLDSAHEAPKRALVTATHIATERMLGACMDGHYSPSYLHCCGQESRWCTPLWCPEGCQPAGSRHPHQRLTQARGEGWWRGGGGGGGVRRITGCEWQALHAHRRGDRPPATTTLPLPFETALPSSSSPSSVTLLSTPPVSPHSDTERPPPPSACDRASGMSRQGGRVLGECCSSRVRLTGN
jgi:hypothetical protein